jgi:hypothetical protein
MPFTIEYYEGMLERVESSPRLNGGADYDRTTWRTGLSIRTAKVNGTCARLKQWLYRSAIKSGINEGFKEKGVAFKNNDIAKVAAINADRIA